MNAIDAQCACGRGVGQVAQDLLRAVRPPHIAIKQFWRRKLHHDHRICGCALWCACSFRTIGDLPGKKRTDLMVGASVFYGLAARIRLCESISSGLRKSAGAGSQHYAVGVLYRGTTMASAIAEAGLWILILSAALVQSGWAGSATGCDRTCLEFFANRYLAALVAHDKSGVAAVEGVKNT